MSGCPFSVDPCVGISYGIIHGRILNPRSLVFFTNEGTKNLNLWICGSVDLPMWVFPEKKTKNISPTELECVYFSVDRCHGFVVSSCIIYLPIWRSPKIGLRPVIISFNRIFHEINHPAIGVSPIYGNHHMVVKIVDNYFLDGYGRCQEITVFAYSISNYLYIINVLYIYRPYVICILFIYHMLVCMILCNICTLHTFYYSYITNIHTVHMIFTYFIPYSTYNVGKTIINHAQFHNFIGGMFTIPSHGWFLIVFPTLHIVYNIHIYIYTL